jgi:IS30 family transposase
MDLFFAHAYAVWERGTSEHTNGLVQQYVPKGTDYTATSHCVVTAIQSSLNDSPPRLFPAAICYIESPGFATRIHEFS